MQCFPATLHRMLHLLKPSRGSKSSKKRVGRGNGSGRGTFCGRGCKGQQSRSGGGKGPQFEGGQTPLIRRQPKFGGFRNPNREEYEVINLDTIEEKLDAGSYDFDALKKSGLIEGNLPVKILGRGKVTKKFKLTVDGVSKSAKEAIEKVGGSVTII